MMLMQSLEPVAMNWIVQLGSFGLLCWIVLRFSDRAIKALEGMKAEIANNSLVVAKFSDRLENFAEGMHLAQKEYVVVRDRLGSDIRADINSLRQELTEVKRLFQERNQ
jgi:predicted HAD superfamily phosphohydrolase YqeG